MSNVRCPRCFNYVPGHATGAHDVCGCPPERLTREQITERFTAELHALLAKWGAELEAADHYQGYPECGEDVRVTVTVPARYDSNGDTIREYTEIDLGRFIPRPIQWRELKDSEQIAAGDEFRLPLLSGWSPVYPEMVGKTRPQVNDETPSIVCRFAAIRRKV